MKYIDKTVVDWKGNLTFLYHIGYAIRVEDNQ